jgi:hypothetical protein
MRRLRDSRAAFVLVVALALSMFTATSAFAHGSPTCSDVGLDIEVHGEHVTRDYVFAPGATNAAGGAQLPGGPGPAFHFENGFAPGASFCTDANSGIIYTKNPNLAGD